MSALRLPRLSRATALLLLAFCLASAGCPPTTPGGGPPVNVQVLRAPNGPTLWSQHINDLSDTYSWPGPVLGPLPTTPVDNPPLRAQFDIDFVTSGLRVLRHVGLQSGIVLVGLHTLHEAQFYIVDPSGLLQQDTTYPGAGALPFDFNEWVALNTPPPADVVSMPDAVVIPYPAANRGGVAEAGYLTTAPLTTYDFIGASRTLLGQDSMNGSGTIKAVRIVDSGMCSAEIPYAGAKGLLAQIQSNAQNFVLGSAGCNSNVSSSINMLNLTSVVDSDPDDIIGAFGYYPNSRGGFVLRGIVDVNSTGSASLFGLGSCDVAADYYYQLGINYGPIPGILSASPVRHVLSYNGSQTLCNSGCLGSFLPGVVVSQGVGQELQSALEQTIPDLIFDAAAAMQMFPVPDLVDDPTGKVPIPELPCVEGTRFTCGSDSDCPPVGFAQYCDLADIAVLQSGGTYGVCKVKDPCGTGTYVYPDGTMQEIGGVFSAGGKSTTPSGRFVVEQAVIAGVAQLGLSPANQTALLAAVDATTANGVYSNFACTPGTVPLPDQMQALTCKYIVRAKRAVHHPDSVELVFLDDTNNDSDPTYAAFVGLFAVSPTAYQQMCQRGYPSVPSSNFLTRRFAVSNIQNQGCGSLQPPVSNCSPTTPCPNGQVCASGFCGYPPCLINPNNGAAVCPTGLVCQFDSLRDNECGLPCTADSQCGVGNNGLCFQGSCWSGCQSAADCSGFPCGANSSGVSVCLYPGPMAYGGYPAQRCGVINLGDPGTPGAPRGRVR
jgi:hypothetical protein